MKTGARSIRRCVACLASLDSNTAAKLPQLSEQLSDLSVNIAEEVHVGSTTVQTFILHQKLTE